MNMNWWRHTPVFFKILSAFLLAMVLFGSFDTYLAVTLSHIESLTMSLHDNYEVLSEFSELLAYNNDLTGAVESFVITRNPSWQGAYDADSAKRQALLNALAADSRLTLSERTDVSRVSDKIGALNGVELLVLAKASQGDTATASQLFGSFYSGTEHEIAAAIGSLVDERTANVAQLIAENDARLMGLKAVIAVLFVVFVAIFVVLWLILSRGLVRPIERLTEVVRKIAGGDLEAKVDVESADEIGELASAFGEMTAEIRRAYLSLQRERAQLIASINSLPFGFLIIDPRRNTILMNDAAKTLFSGTDVLTFDEVARQFEGADAITEAYREMIESGAEHEVSEMPLRGRFFRIVIAPILLQDSRAVIGSVMLFDDVTERKRLDQAKNAFMAIASHEMRTPLSVIRGNAELMLDDPAVSGSAAVSVQAQGILRASVRLLSIVNDFLDMQNVEEGKIVLKNEYVDVGKVLAETVSDLRNLAAEKNVALLFDEAAAPKLPLLTLDKYRLQQIFTNLISNAIHYTDKGIITISVAVESEKGQVKVFFQDTGLGISKEDQARLFGKFQTGKAFLRSKEYGSGMGLYISRLLARLMNGDIALERSELGGGSTFSLALPLPKK